MNAPVPPVAAPGSTPPAHDPAWATAPVAGMGEPVAWQPPGLAQGYETGQAQGQGQGQATAPVTGLQSPAPTAAMPNFDPRRAVGVPPPIRPDQAQPAYMPYPPQDALAAQSGYGTAQTDGLVPAPASIHEPQPYVPTPAAFDEAKPIKDRLFAQAADPQPGSVRKPFLLGLLCGAILVLILGQVFRAVGPEPDPYAPVRAIPSPAETAPADEAVPALTPQALVDVSSPG